MSAEELLGAAAGRQRRTVAASLVAAGREGRASDEKVTLVGNRVHAVRRDVLRMRMSASAVCPICISEAGAYVAFLGEMSLDAFIEDELRVKVVEEALERADASFRRYDLIPPRLGDDVQNFRVQVVEAAVATDGGTGESDERTGREGVFGRPLVQRRLVVVCVTSIKNACGCDPGCGMSLASRRTPLTSTVVRSERQSVSIEPAGNAVSA